MTISNPYIPEFKVNKLIDEIQSRFQFIIHSHPVTLRCMYELLTASLSALAIQYIARSEAWLLQRHFLAGKI
jgi:hypothetical protein